MSSSLSQNWPMRPRTFPPTGVDCLIFRDFFTTPSPISWGFGFVFNMSGASFRDEGDLYSFCFHYQPHFRLLAVGPPVYFRCFFFWGGEVEVLEIAS